MTFVKLFPVISCIWGAAVSAFHTTWKIVTHHSSKPGRLLIGWKKLFGCQKNCKGNEANCFRLSKCFTKSESDFFLIRQNQACSRTSIWLTCIGDIFWFFHHVWIRIGFRLIWKRNSISVVISTKRELENSYHWKKALSEEKIEGEQPFVS